MSFAHPEVFLLLILVPLILLGAILASRKRGRAWRALVASRLEPYLVRSGSVVPRWVSFGLALLGFALLITALAGPNAGYKEEEEKIRGRNLLLAIDISRSMLAKDESPNRLAAALAAALEVVDHFPNDRIGLIAFSGTAFLNAPLTVDHGAVRESIQQLDPLMLQQLDADLMPRGGSDVGQAIHLAIDTLKKTGQKNNALIILSDGEHHEDGFESAAEKAAEDGVTIFTAGFGTAEGDFIPDPDEQDKRFRDRDDNLVFTRLNTETLRLLARRTDGFYTRGSGRHFASNLETAVERLDRYELEGRKRRVAIPRFQWFLLPAIVLFILSMIINTPWQILGRASAVILALFCLPTGAEARLLPATPAERSFARGDFEEALDLFDDEIAKADGERLARLQLGAGAAAYRINDFDRASASYSAALLSSEPGLQSDAHYALANSLFKFGENALKSAGKDVDSAAMEKTIAQWNNALQHYEDCLETSSDHEQAKGNHAFVKKRLEELKQEKEQKEEEEKKEQEKEDSKKKEDKNDQEKNEDEQENKDGENDPQKNEGEPKDPGEEGEDPEDKAGDQPNEEEGQPKDGDEGQESDGGKEQDPNKTDQPREVSGEPQQTRPGETPEEAASRILSENADFQTTPLMPKQKSRKRPEKDW